MKKFVCSCGAEFETYPVFMVSSQMESYGVVNQEEFWKHANDKTHRIELIDR